MFKTQQKKQISFFCLTLILHKEQLLISTSWRMWVVITLLADVAARFFRLFYIGALIFVISIYGMRT